jgi:hypothetical protein
MNRLEMLDTVSDDLIISRLLKSRPEEIRESYSRTSPRKSSGL